MTNASPEYIRFLLNEDPGIKLLHSRNGAEIIAFFYTLFREDRIQILDEEQFELRLIDNIVYFRESFDESVDSSNGESDENAFDSADDAYMTLTFPERQQQARSLITKWASEKLRYIRRIRTDEGNFIELSASTERILSFVEDIEGQPFVGTESRFLDILHRLRDLTEHTTENPEQRIKQLTEQRAQLKEQIDQIKNTGQTYTYSINQITERLHEISRNARDLLADFRQMEENFRKIIASLYTEADFAEYGKGKILGYTLDANRKLRDSPQGQSFSSFWNFLAQDSGKNEINNMTSVLFQRIREQKIAWNDDFLLHLKSALHEAGKKIVNTNRLLADRLNRVLARQEEEDRKLILQHIHSIKNLSIRCMEHSPKNTAFMEIDTKPVLFFPQARYPVLPGKEKTIISMESAGEDLVLTGEVLQNLFHQFYIDEAQLLKTIEQFREKHQGMSQFSLSELAAEFPIRKGLAEIIGYISLASQLDWARILDAETETIHFSSVEEKTEMKITLPKVMFL